MNLLDERSRGNPAVIRIALRRALRVPASMLFLASVPYAGPAFAQEAGVRSLEEVVVTARRREESAQDVPVTVTAIDGNALEDYNIERFGDLQKIVPTLQINDGTGRRNAPNYAIRGIRPTESLYGQDPSVAAYFAEVVMSPAEGSNLALYDLASVQVLKGPQGTLFGRNTNGGAVLFTPQRPGTEFGGDVSVGYGSFNLIEAEAAVDVPISERFLTRVAGRTLSRDGHQENVITGQEYGGESTNSARLSALWQVTDTVENQTIVTWDQARSEGRAAVIVAVSPTAAGLTATGLRGPIEASLARQQQRDVDDVEADYPQREFVDALGVFNTTTFDLGGGMTLKNIMGYRDVEYESAYDQDGSSARLVLSATQPADLQHWSEELQLFGTAFGDKLDWQTGFYYYHEEGGQFADGRVLGGVQYVGGDIDSDSYSVFAQGTYKFTPAWAFTLGGRYTKDDKAATSVNRTATACNIRNDANQPLPLNACFKEGSKSFSAPTGTVSLEWTPSEDVLVYLASRRGYRAGGFNLRATFAPTAIPFDEEIVTDVELGTKLEWSAGDWQFRTNVALFYQWYKDIQRSVAELVPGVGIATAIQNAAEARIPGGELEATIAPTENLSFVINYAYLDPKYTEWSDTVLVAGQPVARDLTDTPFQYVPKHQGSATIRYEVALGASAGTLALQGTYSARSHVWINAFGTIADIRATPAQFQWTLQQDAYDFVDLNATWAGVMGSNLELSAYVKNATDERYVVGSISQFGGIGFNTQVYSDPRMYGAQLRYRF